MKGSRYGDSKAQDIGENSLGDRIWRYAQEMLGLSKGAFAVLSPIVR